MAQKLFLYFFKCLIEKYFIKHKAFRVRIFKNSFNDL